jgi:hypothetical protein
MCQMTVLLLSGGTIARTLSSHGDVSQSLLNAAATVSFMCSLPEPFGGIRDPSR